MWRKLLVNINCLRHSSVARKSSTGKTLNSPLPVTGAPTLPDRGVPEASLDYTQLLTDHGIRISLSRRGNAYDNAKAESFIKTLKYEEVYLFEYETQREARTRIGHFLEEVYNEKRLHFSIGNVPPAEFEQQFEPSDSA